MGNDPSFPSVTNNISSIGNLNHCPSSKLNSSDVHDVAATNIAATNKKDDDVSSTDNWSRLSARSVVHSLATSMKDNLRHTFQHYQGCAAGSSVYSCINSVLCGGINAPRNPPSQVLFAQPTVVHHFHPYGTLGNNTAPTADSTHAPATPGCTVDYPSFPTYHAPSMNFGSSDVNLIMASIPRNINSTDPFGHTPPHVPVPPHAATHTGPPDVSSLPTFLVNPAPVSGSVPPLSGPPHGPHFGTTRCPSPLAPPSAPSGPPSYNGPPIVRTEQYNSVSLG